MTKKPKFKILTKGIEPFATDATAIFNEPFLMRTGEEAAYSWHCTPLGFNTRFAPQAMIWGIANLVLHPTRHQVIGYNFLYESDYGITHAYEHADEAHQVAQLISQVTGTCLLLRSLKGWHFISLNIIPYGTFRTLALKCEPLMPTDFRYLILRYTKKSSEHTMNRFQQFYTVKSPYPISRQHRELWEQLLGTWDGRGPLTLKHQQIEIDTRLLQVRYPSWS